MEPKTCNRLPPGPHGLSLLMHQAIEKPFNKILLSKWAKEYGKLYTIYFSGNPVVVINDCDLIRELCSKLAAAGKLTSAMATLPLMWSGNHGILNNTKDDDYVEHKRFLANSLHEVGFWRESYIESLSDKELHKLYIWIAEFTNKTWDSGKTLIIHDAILHSISNVVWAMLTGNENPDKELKQSEIGYLIKKWTDTFNASLKQGQVTDSWIETGGPVVNSGHREMKNVSVEVQECMERLFKEHRETRKSGEPARDIIDAYIDKMKNCEDKDSSFYGEAGGKNCFASLINAHETLSSFIGEIVSCLMHYLSANVNVQSKVQQEVDKVIGRHRMPTLVDKKSMPYLDAVIMEVLRFSSPLPVSSSVKILTGMSFHGYYFPKGTKVLQNELHKNNDKKIWGDPEKFRPDRFMKGNEHLKELVMVLKTPRKARGTTNLLQDIMFLYVTKLLQNYNFSVDPKKRKVKEYLRPRPGVNLCDPEKLAVLVTQRLFEK